MRLVEVFENQLAAPRTVKGEDQGSIRPEQPA
jgi:hypothetical protein